MEPGKLTELEQIFRELEEEIEHFSNLSNLECPSGCGKCCDRADTEVNDIEASFIARYIEDRIPSLAKDLVRKVERRRQVSGNRECLFYNGGADLHCVIYPARPLICRCFGTLGEQDKIGAVLFPACLHMNLPSGFRSGDGIVRILRPPFPPVMAEYRDRINILQGEPVRMKSLADAVLEHVVEAGQ